MEKIIDGIYWIKGLTMGRVYVIESADGLTLIDSSLANSTPKIEKDLGTIGKGLRDIRRILITHAHPDHIGSTSALQKASGAQVYVHARDAAVTRGDTPMVLPDPATLSRAATLMARMMPPTKLEGARVDRELQEGNALDEVLPGFTLVETFGHSPGHSSYWWPQKRLLFCGDTLMRLPNLRLPIAAFTVDMAEAKRSVRKIVDLGVDILCLGHGNPITENTTATLKAFAAKAGV